MLLNNYWNYKSYFDKYYPRTSGIDTIYCGVKRTDGVELAIYASNSGDQLYNCIQKLKLGVLVGTGNTEPTPSDYSLESDVTASITNFTTSVTIGSEEGKETTVVSITGLNNTVNSITISEIGIYKALRSGAAGYEDWFKSLFIRHVLETPKTVAPGEGFSLTFEWTEQ